jgi:RNA polymerase sigma-70 factor (ECF subfamily)
VAAVYEENRLQVIDWPLIVKKHGPAVWQTAYRLLGNNADAADCFQETFVCALEVARREPVRNFPALLARLATARAIDKLRRRSRESRVRTDAVDVVGIAGNNPGPAQHLYEQQLTIRLREALAALPPQEAEVFCLRFLNDMSYRQIAKELGIKTNTAGVLLHRARTKLSELFEKE